MSTAEKTSPEHKAEHAVHHDYTVRPLLRRRWRRRQRRQRRCTVARHSGLLRTSCALLRRARARHRAQFLTEETAKLHTLHEVRIACGWRFSLLPRKFCLRVAVRLTMSRATARRL